MVAGRNYVTELLGHPPHPYMGRICGWLSSLFRGFSPSSNFNLFNPESDVHWCISHKTVMCHLFICVQLKVNLLIHAILMNLNKGNVRKL